MSNKYSENQINLIREGDKRHAEAKQLLSIANKTLTNKETSVVLPCVYIYFNENIKPLYIGSAKQLRSRHRTHMRSISDSVNEKIKKQYRYYGVIFCQDLNSAQQVERLLIDILKPKLNDKNNKNIICSIPSNVLDNSIYDSFVKSFNQNIDCYIFTRDEIDKEIFIYSHNNVKMTTKQLINYCVNELTTKESILIFFKEHFGSKFTYKEYELEETAHSMIGCINYFNEFKDRAYANENIRMRWERHINYLEELGRKNTKEAKEAERRINYLKELEAVKAQMIAEGRIHPDKHE